MGVGVSVYSAGEEDVGFIHVTNGSANMKCARFCGTGKIRA